MSYIQTLQACQDIQTEMILTNIQGKTIDISKILPAPVSPPTTPGWFQLPPIPPATNSGGIIYSDTSDATYDYSIVILTAQSPCTQNPITNCSCISIGKTYKDGTPGSDTIIPAATMTNALSSLPSIVSKCGTGIWNGCTAGIQNKYLIIGGGAVLLLLMSR